jgi:hypothetical protein
LAKRPDDRFQNPAQLSAALASCTDQLGLAPARVALPAYWSNWTSRPVPLGRHAAWLIPTVLLVLGVLGLGLWWNHQAAPPEFTDLQLSAPAASGEGTLPTARAGGLPANELD